MDAARLFTFSTYVKIYHKIWFSHGYPLVIRWLFVVTRQHSRYHQVPLLVLLLTIVDLNNQVNNIFLSHIWDSNKLHGLKFDRAYLEKIDICHTFIVEFTLFFPSDNPGHNIMRHSPSPIFNVVFAHAQVQIQETTLKGRKVIRTNLVCRKGGRLSVQI